MLPAVYDVAWDGDGVEKCGGLEEVASDGWEVGHGEAVGWCGFRWLGRAVRGRRFFAIKVGAVLSWHSRGWFDVCSKRTLAKGR